MRTEKEIQQTAIAEMEPWGFPVRVENALSRLGVLWVLQIVNLTHDGYEEIDGVYHEMASMAYAAVQAWLHEEPPTCCPCVSEGEIQRRCARIRAGWTDSDYERRACESVKPVTIPGAKYAPKLWENARNRHAGRK